MSVQVGKLTVRAPRRGAGRDAGFRIRAESRLRSLDLCPAGLPAHAILIVRRLVLPAADRPTAQQARTGLDRLRETAARPAAGPVTADAQAVLFGDEAELLACLTADLVHGVAGQRWYWRQAALVQGALLPGAGPGPALAAAWLRDVRWLPASLARLSEWEARQAVSLLSRAEATGVLRALLAAYDAGEPPGPPDPGPALPADEPPWRRWLPPQPLPEEAETLWGVALSLHHAPAVGRGPGYARQLAAWRAAGGQESRSPGASAGTPGEGVRGTSDSARESSAEGIARVRAPMVRGAMDEERLTGRGPGDGAPGRERSAAAEPAGTESAGMEAAGTARTVPGGRRNVVRSHDFDRETPPAGARVEERREAATSPAVTGDWNGREASARPGRLAWRDEGIVTGLASMLFLINFVVWLDDRADEPWPGGWALVELLGRYLLGDRLEELAGDPLWDVLAALDGRPPGTRPAVEPGPGDPLRLPRAWLERWPPPPSGYVARLDGERLVVRHAEAGFAAADVPCPAGAFDEVLAAEATWLGDVEASVDGPAEPDLPASRFGASVGAFVRWLLRSRGIAASALAQPGRAQVTGTHVDVVLSLEDVDLPTRAAGLDGDPGWVPALGRIVLFHFWR